MIVLLHGADTFRAKNKVKEITRSYENAHHNTVRSFYFDCKEAHLEEVKNILGTVSLFEKKKLVVLENLFQNSAFVEWMESQKQELHQTEQHVMVLFESEAIKNKTNNKLYQWLKKHTKHQEFLALSADNLKRWIAREFQQYGLEAAPRIQEMLARTVGSDLWRMSKVIQTIAAYKKTDTSVQVKESDVALFVPAHTEADVFATIDAMVQQNKKQAFELLYRHMQKGDAPYYIFSMVQYQIRTLLEIKDAMEKYPSRQDIAHHIKIHPYVLQKGMRVAEKFSLQELKAIYNRLFTIDWRLKTGRANPEAALDLFFATL